MLSGQRPFDRSRLIRRAGITLESGRPNEGSRVGDHEKRDLKQVSFHDYDSGFVVEDLSYPGI